MTTKEKPYSFWPSEAVQHGVEKAVILYNLRHWLSVNKAAGKDMHAQEGYWWTYNTAKAFEELMPFFSRRSISRWLSELEGAGIIKSGIFNAAAYDRTKWYTIPSEFSIDAIGQIVQTIGQNGQSNGQNGQAIGQNGQPIPVYNPDDNPDYKHSLDAQSALPVIEQPKQVKPKKQKLTANDLFNEFKTNWPLIAQCDDEILHAWCQVRIEKKAIHTELAHKAIEHELSILIHHGLTVTQAIREAAANGWKGLKASWYDVVKYAGNAKPVDNYRTAAGAIERLNDTSWAE